PAGVIQNIDDTGRLIEDDHRGGAQAQATGLTWAVEVERCIELGLGQKAHAEAARNTTLGLAALPDAAGVLVHQLPDGDTQRQLHTTRLVDVAADAVEFRPVAAGVARVLGVGGYAHRLEPIGAAVHDMGHAGQRFDVVDDRRLAEGPLDGGKRRLDPRPGAPALQAFQQARFLATDVGPGAAVLKNVEVEVLAEDVAAQQVSGVGFVDGLLHGPEAGAVFVADVEVGGAGPGRVTGGDGAFQDRMGGVFHAGAGL